MHEVCARHKTQTMQRRIFGTIAYYVCRECNKELEQLMLEREQMSLETNKPVGYRKAWRGGERPEIYRSECIDGRWVVKAHMPCINGLAAWVEIADCGKPDESDQMCGLDRQGVAERIVAALEAARSLPPAT